jgi:Concanavalin A-like lectin/glucanases superfamily
MKKRWFFISLFLFCILEGNGQINLDSMLVAHYPFNGNTINNAGPNFNGIVGGAQLTTDRFGSPDRAYSFDGINDYINLISDFDFQERTLLFWFQAFNITPNLQAMYDSDHLNLQYGKTGISLWQVGGENILRYHQGISATRTISGINNNEWYMATISVGPDSCTYFLNDSLWFTVLKGVGHSQSGNNYSSLGQTRVNDRFFNGKIDDARIYNRGISPCEVKYIYRGLSPPFFRIKPNMFVILI